MKEKSCENCVYYNEVDDYTFWCDYHGACTMESLEPCSKYKPMESEVEG